jgi:L-ascorbate metabolism protein UlaG (beta-lactamase superfamily)
MRRFLSLPLAAAGLAALAFAQPAAAQQEERCPKLVAERPLPVIRAAFQIAAALQPEEARLTFLGHSTFLIESPKRIRIATDYSGYNVPDSVPDIITMNRAHTSHYTDHPDPAIRFVLRGWTESGEPARHDLSLEDVWVSNVATDIRGWGGDTVVNGNSIFLFEVSGVCIAHLGHLHHKLDPGHLKRIGRMDVVLVPVDGGYTLNQFEMTEVLAQLGAPLVIPMHFFGGGALERFIQKLGETHVIQRSDSPSVTVSRATLPARPTLLVLPGH